MAPATTNYEEIQHDEIEALRSIYMDDFVEEGVKTGAWNVGINDSPLLSSKCVLRFYCGHTLFWIFPVFFVRPINFWLMILYRRRLIMLSRSNSRLPMVMRKEVSPLMFLYLLLILSHYHI